MMAAGLRAASEVRGQEGALAEVEHWALLKTFTGPA